MTILTISLAFFVGLSIMLAINLYRINKLYNSALVVMRGGLREYFEKMFEKNGLVFVSRCTDEQKTSENDYIGALQRECSAHYNETLRLKDKLTEAGERIRQLERDLSQEKLRYARLKEQYVRQKEPGEDDE